MSSLRGLWINNNNNNNNGNLQWHFHGVALHPLFPDRIGIWSVGFCGGRKTGEPGENPRSGDENQQQTQPTCDVRSGNRTRATVVGGERSHHCAIPTPITTYLTLFCNCRTEKSESSVKKVPSLHSLHGLHGLQSAVCSLHGLRFRVTP